MKKQLSTKKALIASILTLCMCFAMLVGTTFAWFTDSVTSSGNVIKTGTLKVGFYWSEAYNVDPATAKWENAKDGAIFKNDKWEPGYTEARHLKIVNEGTLALRYKLAIIPHGEVSELADVIDVYVINGAQELENRNEPIDQKYYVGSLREFIGTKEQVNDSGKVIQTNNSITAGKLSGEGTEGSIYDATIVLKMQETAGNEYQNLSIGSDFSIQLLATQVEAEGDSFGSDYDKNAYTVVNTVAELRSAITAAVDTTTIFVQPGDYTLNSMLSIEGKSINIVGLGVVNIKNNSTQHMFTIQDNSNPNSEMNVTIKNVNLDGANIGRNGFNVKYNVTANFENVTVKNTVFDSVILDNGNLYTDKQAYEGTDTVVNMKNCNVESVAMNSFPVVDTHLYADHKVNTYAHLNFDGNTFIGSIEKQKDCANHKNLYINGDNDIVSDFIFLVENDAQLAKALNTIKTNRKYWNVDVTVKLAAGEYSGDHVIDQYPEAKGNNTDYANKYTNLNFVANGSVEFTGNVTVKGSGYSGGAFNAHSATTTFTGVTFDAANSVEANGEDYIAMYVTAAASNVKFVGCTFENATHVTLGGSGSTNGVGKVDVIDCTFNDGGCLSGYVETLNVSDTTVTAARNGFIDKKKSGPITVDNCDVVCSVYFIRTDNSGINATVTNTTVKETDVTNSKGTGLVVFRGSGHKVEFIDCTTLNYGTLQGGAGTGIIYNFYDIDGVTYRKDMINGDVVLYDVSKFSGSELAIPEGVTSIGYGTEATGGRQVLAGNKNIKKVVFSSTVTTIGYQAFKDSAVEEVVLNEGLTEIGEFAFNGAKNLAKFNIPSTVTTIGTRAFRSTAATEVVLHAGITSITEAFRDMPNLASVTVHGNTYISNFSFRDCPSLRTVYLLGEDITLGGSTTFCNASTNNPNVNNITFYVSNHAVAQRVKTAMGVGTTFAINVKNGDDYIEVEENNFVKNSDALAEAIASGKTDVILGKGTYTLPNLAGKTLTIGGDKDAVIDLSNIAGTNQFASGANLVFDGVTLEFTKTTSGHQYYGLPHVASLVYKNCDINGQQCLYADKVEFVNCNFTATSTEHCLWTYSAEEVNFTDCTFTYSDRCINVYADTNPTETVVNINNCTFISTSENSIGAVEINSSLFSIGITVNMNNCNAPAYGEMVYVSEYDATAGAKTNITVDSKDTYVVYVGNKWAPAETDANALAAALTADKKNIKVILLEEINVPITSLGSQTPGSGQYKLGGENTESITIDLNNNKLNITTTYWSAIGAKNANAVFTIKNGSMTSSQTSGTWNSYDLGFTDCQYVIENVTFDKAIYLDSSANLKNIIINETHDYYAIWIPANGQTINIDGLTVNSQGRGIKIDEEYVGADEIAKVTLSVSNATFDTESKAAILVKSAAGAEITLSNVDISNVAKDTTNAVWVDEDAAQYEDLVTVTGGNIIVEP